MFDWFTWSTVGSVIAIWVTIYWLGQAHTEYLAFKKAILDGLAAIAAGQQRRL